MKHWTSEEIRCAQQLVKNRASDDECLAAVGRSFHACYVKVDRLRQNPPRAYRKEGSGIRERTPDHVWRERERRYAAASQRSLTAILMGDPA